MSNVVPFQPDRRRPPGRDGSDRSAEIVFFTGIRYVRLEDDEVAGGTAATTVPDERADAGMLAERLLA